MLINLPENHDNLSSIALKLSCMSITNVEWSCLHSGAGIIHSSGEKPHRGSADSPSSVYHLKCLYKKSKPVFSKLPEGTHKSEPLCWEDKSFSRIITPDSQAMAILSMCSCAELLYSTDPALASSLIKNAGYYRDFSSTYMRGSDGLFISMEDKTKALDEEPKLKPCSKNGKLSDQALMHEAASYLYSIACQDTLKDFLPAEAQQYRDEKESLFRFLQDNMSQLLSSSTKEISICICSFARCLSLEVDPEITNRLKEFVCLLCAELETRIRITGEVETGPDSLETCSMMTHFRASNAMLEGYRAVGIFKFKELGILIYNCLEDLYSPDLKLYMENGVSKVTCSIRDIADMLKLQLLKYQLDNDAQAGRRLEAMYGVLIENSSIMQSRPGTGYSVMGQVISLPDHIPDTISIGRAPVFVKSIKFNLKKDVSIKASKHFNSLYSLYASYTFLHYFLQQYQSVSNIPHTP